jgi:carboxymethylenebutenolidase
MSFNGTVSGPDGEFGLYISYPKEHVQSNGTAIVVIQEIFGVNEVMREIADTYSEQGYTAIVPDLFWRIEPNISITDKTPDEMKRAFELFGLFNIDDGIIDITATIEHVRTTMNISKVGCVGYCLGGLLSYLTSCRTSIDCSVSYYGVSINDRLDEMKNVKNPTILHIASNDKFVPKEAQEKIIAAAATTTTIKTYLYDGLDHAFARIGSEHYDANGATLANERTMTFFNETLLK